MRRMADAHYNITIGQSPQSHNTEQVRDHGRSLQGVVNGPSNMTSHHSSRYKRRNTGDSDEERESADRRDQAPTGSEVHEPNYDPQNDDAYSLEQHLAELAQKAVSFQIKLPLAGKSAECEPVKTHYSDHIHHTFKEGELYRIWRPTNTETHLSTFLIMSITGDEMSCLKIVRRDSEDADFRFRNSHGELKMEEDKPRALRSSTRLRPKQKEDGDDVEEPDVYLGIMDKQQRFKDSCWIDMLYPFNINWRRYDFVYCGCLQEESIEKARERHLKLYNNRHQRK